MYLVRYLVILSFLACPFQSVRNHSHEILLGITDEINMNMEALLEVRQAELRRHVTSTLTLKRVPSLKRMCRLRGIRVGGKKAELVERLVCDVLEKGWTVSSEADLWKDFSLRPDSPADRERQTPFEDEIICVLS